MPITLFDAFSGFGGSTPGERTIIPLERLINEMAHVDISQALVRITPIELDTDVIASNERLYFACRRHQTLVPCPVVLPGTAGDVASDEEQVTYHLKQGAGAVCIRPERDYWNLAPWNSDALFHALEESRLPVACLDALVPLDQVASLAGRYPDLRILLMQTNYRQVRSVTPLLRAFGSLYLVLGQACAAHTGIEHWCREIGASRLLFGTGFPVSEPMAAVTYLMYADISSEERQFIGSGNMERLQKEIVR